MQTGPALIDECPTGYVQPQSYEWLELFDRAGLAREATGALLFGADLGEWPAAVVDAFSILQNEERMWEEMQ